MNVSHAGFPRAHSEFATQPFAAGLASELAGHLPAGTSFPTATDAAGIAALPANIRAIYLDAYVAALHPVFLSAAAIALVAFALTWLLREVPLREAARTDDIGDSFAMPRHATSLEELETIIARVTRREHRWEAIRRIAARLDLQLEPDEIWLLIQLCRRDGPVPIAALGTGTGVSRAQLDGITDRLAARGLAKLERDEDLIATDAGRDIFRQMVARYRSRLAEILERWSPDDHAEVRAMLTSFARELISELPPNPGIQHHLV